jgi:hypothetical protein
MHTHKIGSGDALADMSTSALVARRAGRHDAITEDFTRQFLQGRAARLKRPLASCLRQQRRSTSP